MSKAKNRNSRRMSRRKRKMLLLGIACGAVCAALISAVVWAVFLRDGKDIEVPTPKGLTGKWAIDETTVYEFDDGGKGTMCLPFADYAFEYIVNGDKISIDFEDPSCTDRTYTMELNGDKLLLTRADNVVYEFFRI